MGAVKNFYHDELESRRAVENGHCGQCGEDADLGTEAWTHGLCRPCFDESNSQLGVGA
jgi:NMD protein affecting ribosome stability and mRNA decay